MTFPTIPTVAASRVLFTNQADTSATRTFPSLSSLTKDSGDLLVAIIIGYQSSLTSAIFSSWGASFTEILDIGVSTQHCVGVAYKISDGTETGTFTVTQGGTVTGHATMILLSIPGAHQTTAPAVSAALATGTSSAADPAALNPANWDVEDTLWIAVGGSGMTSGTGSWTGVASAPANYGNYADSATVDNSTVGQVEGAVAFRQNATASEDVATFSVDTSNARNCAFVIAVRPSNAVTGTGAGTGTAASAAGTAAETFSGTGAGAGSAATAEGSAAETFTATGTGTGAAATASGDGTETFTGTGAGVGTASTGDGAGDVSAGDVTGTGDGVQVAASAAGDATETFTGTGAGGGTASSGSGTGAETFSAAGAGAGVASTSSGIGTETFSGTGASVQVPASGAGSDLQPVTGTGAGMGVGPSALGTGTVGAEAPPVSGVLTIYDNIRPDFSRKIYGRGKGVGSPPSGRGKGHVSTDELDFAALLEQIGDAA